MDTLKYDIIVIGAGIAGLSFAIKLKQLCIDNNIDLSIIVLEKSSEIGGNIISGCVFEAECLKDLFGDKWQEYDLGLNAKVTDESLLYLTIKNSFRLPILKKWANHNNYVISLSQLCKKLAIIAESLGVDILPNVAVDDILLENNAVVGVNANTKSEEAKIEIYAKQTVVAEGVAGVIGQKIINHFKLDENISSVATYGLGIKEIWQIDAKYHKLGTVQHYIGYPLQNKAYGGGFVYHLENSRIAVGLVSSLDYKNPYFSPYDEFQQFKLHKKIRPLLETGALIEYGARVVAEGGVCSIPNLSFAGGLIVGDSASLLNIAKIKGSHNALKSGVLAANSIFETVRDYEIAKLNHYRLTTYETTFKQSAIYKELYKVRNFRPAFKKGLLLGLLYNFIEHYVLRSYVFWTFKLTTHDRESLMKKHLSKKIYYPAYDKKITYDREYALSFSNLHYAEYEHTTTNNTNINSANSNQLNNSTAAISTNLSHISVNNPFIPIILNLDTYDAPETRYCPASVYKIIHNNSDDTYHLQISPQNCLHCKACVVKDPAQNINWTNPQGGSGPQYNYM